MSIAIIRAWDDSGGQHLLDIKGNQSFPTTFQLADVLELKSSKSNFNKSISLPATDRNVEYFGQYWDANNVTGFNPKTKKRAILEYSSVKVLDGFIQLVSVTVENGRTAEFNVRVFSEVADLFKLTSKKLLKDTVGLDAGFDHSLALNTVAAGFTGLGGSLNIFTDTLDTVEVDTGGGANTFTTDYSTVVSAVVSGENVGEFEKTTDAGAAQYNFDCEIGKTYRLDITIVSQDAAMVGSIFDFFFNQYGAATLVVGLNTYEWTAVTVGHTWAINTGGLAGDVVQFDNIILTEIDGDAIFYGLQDYGELLTGTGLDLEQDDPTQNLDIYAPSTANKVKHLTCKPYLKLKPILNLIMAEAGYTYESAFLDAAYFESVYLLAHNGGSELSVDSSEVYLFKAGLVADFTLSGSLISNQIAFDNETSLDFNDVYGVHGTEVGYTGTTFRSQVETGAFNSIGRNRLRTSLEIRNNSGAPVDVKLIMYVMYDNGFGTPVAVVQTVGFEAIAGGATVVKTLDALEPYLNFAPPNFGGAKSVYVDLFLPTASADLEVLTGADTFFECYESAPYPIEFLPGGIAFTFKASRNVPQKTLQSDILEFLDNRFNLVFVQDKDKPNHLVIEPYNDYVGIGDVKDWSDKLDISKTYTIKPMSSLEKKTVEFVTKEGDDFLNTLVKDNADRIYGQQSFINDINDYANGTKTIKSPDVVSPLNAIQGTDIMIPRLYDESGTPVKGDLRMFVKGDEYTASVGALDLYLRDYEATPNLSNQIVDYTHFGHYKEPIPELDNTDLNYGIEAPFHSVVNTPTNTCYEVYWRKYLDQIYGDEARVLIAQFNLSLFDIESFLWSDRIYCLNAYWTINKISGFDPTGNKSTSVELIRYSTVLSGINNLTETPIYQVASKALDAVSKPTPIPVSKYIVVSADYQVLRGDENIEADTAAVTISLPDPESTGSVYQVINSSTGSITLEGFAVKDTINGDVTVTLFSKEVAEVIYNGTEWKII